VCRDYVKAVVAAQEKYAQELKAAGLDPQNVVLIGCGAANWVKRYREDTGYKGPMFTDPERKLYQALEIHRVQSMSELRGDGRQSPYSDSGLVYGMMWSVQKLWQSGNNTGDTYQQGAVFVLDADGKSLFHHFEKFPADHAKIEDFFKAGGAKL